MLDKKSFANGQQVYEQNGDILTYFFKGGVVKAVGPFVNGLMEGERRFFRKTEQLCQIGNFTKSKKNGLWIRYDKNDKVEYHENFDNDKIIKK